MTDYKELKKTYRNELLTAGMVLGLAQVAILFLQYFLRATPMPGLQTLLSFASFGAIIAVFIIYGRKVAAAYADTPTGFSYGRAFGFCLLVSILSGIIYGVGYYLISQVIDPAYYAEMHRKVLELYASSGMLTEVQLESMKEAMGLLSNLFVVIFGYMFAMLLQGGFVALFVAAMLRRAPGPFTPGNPTTI